MNIEGPFKISAAARLSGLSISMVDYLCRQGIVIPSASNRRTRGKARLFGISDILMLRSLKILLSRGVSVLRLRESINTLRVRYPDNIEGKFPERFLVTNGKDVLFKSKDGVIESINEGGQFAFSFVVDLHDVRDKLAEELNEIEVKKFG